MFFPVFESCLQFRAGDVHGEVDFLFQEIAFDFFCQVHAEAVFGVVFKERCRPGRAVTLGVLRVAAVRCAAAPDTGAAVSVGDHHAVAEELRNDFAVRCFGTACAGTREFEERLFELAADDRILVHRVLLGRQVDDVIPESGFVFFIIEGLHGQGVFRADVGTAAAAQAVHDGDDDIEFIARCDLDFLILITFRCFSCFVSRQQEGTDGSVRTYEGTLVAADTFFSIPARYEHGDAAFFFGAGPCRPAAVFDAVISADRKIVAFEGIDRD